jgi:hypothetical protein
MWLPRCRSISYPTWPSARTTSRPETTGSWLTLDLDQFLRDRGRDRIAVFLQALDVKRDGLLHVTDRFISRRAIRDATGKGWDGSDEDTVLVSLDQYAVLHLVEGKVQKT